LTLEGRSLMSRGTQQHMSVTSYLTKFGRRYIFLFSLFVLSLSYLGCDSSQNETTTPADAASASPSASTSAASAPVATISTPLTGPTSMTLSPANGFEGLTALANVKVAKTAGGLSIHAETGDPQLLLPPLGSAPNNTWTLHIQISSPVTTTLQVFYNTSRSLDFDEAHSVRKPITPGDNDLIVQFTEPDFRGKVRLDPGELKADYVLKLIEGNAPGQKQSSPAGITASPL